MKAPGKTIPRAMALGLVGVAICMFLYGAAIRRRERAGERRRPHAPARHAGCDSRVRAAGARAVRPHLVRHRVPVRRRRDDQHADGRAAAHPVRDGDRRRAAALLRLPASALQDAGGRYRRRGDRADLSCVADQRQSRQHPAPCARRHLRVGHRVPARHRIGRDVADSPPGPAAPVPFAAVPVAADRVECRHHPGDLVHHAAGHERARHLRAVRRDASSPRCTRCSGRSSCSVGIRSPVPVEEVLRNEHVAS